MIFCLGIVVLTLVLQVTSQLTFFPLPSLLSSSPSHLIQVTKIGIFPNHLLISLLSLEVTWEASLVLDLSITKMRGVFAKVTVVLTPSCVALVMLVVGFAQVTVCAITFLVSLLGRIQDPFQTQNNIWQASPKYFFL
jgi:hypothetical protein